MVCIEMYWSVLICINVYWHVLFALVCVYMQCMQWSVLVGISTIFVCICLYCTHGMYRVVLHVLTGIGLYWKVHVCIRMYYTDLYVLACIECNGLYLYVLICIGMYCKFGMYLCIDRYSSALICINVYWHVLHILICMCMYCM